MTSDRFARIESLYHAAREQPVDRRGPYLADACGGDEDLRRDVESLLTQSGAGIITSVIRRAALASGTAIGDYRIVEQIGAGGMGEVYRAHDTKLGRAAAIKVLPATLANDRALLARLEREARLLATLNHPNIARGYGLEESNGTLALVMELVEGDTVADRLMSGAIPIGETLRIARQIVDALAAAHDRGIIHRDLKPANIKLRPDGNVKVLDFGLAKDVESLAGSTATEQGVIVGTAAYMSPEQASGKPVDRRTDLWSFGVVLMEMLTGRRVFDGESTAHILSSVLNTEPNWSSLPEDTSAAVRRLLRRCLAKDPARRLDSANAARLELDDDSSDAAVPERRTYAIQPWISVVLVSAIAALVFMRFYWRWRDGPTSFNETPLTTYAGTQGQPTLSPDGTQFAFVWSREADQGAAQLYVRRLTGGEPLQLTSTAGTFVANPAWSPDGQTIAFIRGTVGTLGAFSFLPVGELTLIPALGGPERVVCKALVTSRVAWSPDGSLLYFAAPFKQTRAISVVSTRGGTSQRVTSPPLDTRGDWDPAVSVDGRRIVFVRRVADWKNELLAADLQDGTIAGPPRTLTHDTREIASPLWLPDGASVIYTSADRYNLGGIYRVPVSGGAPSKLPLSGGDDAVRLALSKNGDRLVYARAFQDDNMYRVQLSSDGTGVGRKTQFGSSTRLEESPSFSRDGRLVFASNRNGSMQIFVADANGSNAIPLTSFTRGFAGNPKWSPDRERIIFDARPDGLADVYSIKADGSDLRRLTDNPAEDNLPCYSTDGKWIYFRSTRSGSGQLYRMPASGREAVQMTSNGVSTSIAAPDGQWIYFSKQGGGVWKIPVNGGDEIPVLSPQTAPLSSGFTVSNVGIYYAGPPDPISRMAPLRLRRFDDGRTVDVMMFDNFFPRTFSVSPDEKWFTWTQRVSYFTDLTLVTNFR